MFASRTNWKLEPNRLSQAIEGHKQSGRRLLDLSVSNPTQAGFAYDQEAVLRALANPRAMTYSPEAKGLPTARQAVAEYYGNSLDPERVILTASTSEGYSFVFRLLCEPGDEVLVPTPSYPLFEFLADIQDVKLRPYELVYDHGWHLDFHSLEQAISTKTRAVVVVHPNNPTGSYVGDKERERLENLCVERNIAIVADEVFLDFALDGKPRCSFAASQRALTFTLSGLSKIAALPQMKAAWIAVSGAGDVAREAMSRLEVIADSYLSVGTPVQLALPALLAQRQAIQRQIDDRVRANLAELDRQLLDVSACSRLEFEGGWYAVMRVPAVQSDEELALKLLEQSDVLVHPGHFYDFPKDGYLVLSLITPQADFAEGLRRLLVAVSAPSC